jgi:hypothetical protein
LIEKRFASPGRHHRENMFSREHGFENFLLSRTEFLEAENPRERFFRLVHGCVHSVPVSDVFVRNS